MSASFILGLYRNGKFCMDRRTLHCNFKGGSTVTNTTTYTATPEEKEMYALSNQMARKYMPNAERLNNTAADILWDSIGSNQVNFDALNSGAQQQIAGANRTVQGLINGQLPSSYQENMQDIVNRGVKSSVGGMLNDLAQRGVINSSVMSQGMKDVSESAANAMADSYTKNVGLLSQLAGQQTDQATAGIAAGAAAQEAAQQPALNLWTASLGLTPSGSGALSAVAGKGTTTSTQKQSGGGSGLGGFFGGLLGGFL